MRVPARNLKGVLAQPLLHTKLQVYLFCAFFKSNLGSRGFYVCILLIYLCVVHAHVCTCGGRVREHVGGCGGILMYCNFFYSSPPYFLIQGLSLNLLDL